MAEATDRYGLPLLQAGQAQKEITHNEAILRMDALLHAAVESQSVASPPSAPPPGASWIVPAGADGAWTDRGGQLAYAHAGGWSFIEPAAGCLAWVKDEGVFAYRTEAGWHSDAWPAKAVRIDGRLMLGASAQSIAAPSGGTVADLEARQVLGQVLVALRQHGLINN